MTVPDYIMEDRPHAPTSTPCPSSPSKKHYWIFGPPTNGASHGICKHCGKDRADADQAGLAIGVMDSASIISSHEKIETQKLFNESVARMRQYKKESDKMTLSKDTPVVAGTDSVQANPEAKEKKKSAVRREPMDQHLKRKKRKLYDSNKDNIVKAWHNSGHNVAVATRLVRLIEGLEDMPQSSVRSKLMQWQFITPGKRASTGNPPAGAPLDVFRPLGEHDEPVENIFNRTKCRHFDPSLESGCRWSHLTVPLDCPDCLLYCPFLGDGGCKPAQGPAVAEYAPIRESDEAVVETIRPEHRPIDTIDMSTGFDIRGEMVQVSLFIDAMAAYRGEMSMVKYWLDGLTVYLEARAQKCKIILSDITPAIRACPSKRHISAFMTGLECSTPLFEHYSAALE